MHQKYDYNFSTSFAVCVAVVIVVVKLACNQIYMCQQCLYAIRTVGRATAIKRGATYQQVARATSTATATAAAAATTVFLLFWCKIDLCNCLLATG